jgi:hypothetical protein
MQGRLRGIFPTCWKNRFQIGAVEELKGLEPEQQREVWKEATQSNPKPSDKEVKKAVAKVTEAAPVPEPPVEAAPVPEPPVKTIVAFPAEPATAPVQNRFLDHLRKGLEHVDHASKEVERAASYGEGLSEIRENLERASTKLRAKLNPKINPPLNWAVPRKNKYFEVTVQKIEMGTIRKYTRDKNGKRIFDDEDPKRAMIRKITGITTSVLRAFAGFHGAALDAAWNEISLEEAEAKAKRLEQTMEAALLLLKGRPRPTLKLGDNGGL